MERIFQLRTEVLCLLASADTLVPLLKLLFSLMQSILATSSSDSGSRKYSESLTVLTKYSNHRIFFKKSVTFLKYIHKSFPSLFQDIGKYIILFYILVWWDSLNYLRKITDRTSPKRSSSPEDSGRTGFMKQVNKLAKPFQK